jgi:acetylornithine aminotransferase
MSATGQDKIKTGYGPMLETFTYVPYNDLNSLEAEMSNEVAAVMLEVIQGEGGLHPADYDFLASVEELCKEHGTLFVIDEVQTGNGRTGKPFAFQHYGLNPDIISTAKGLASGFPIGAIIGKESLKDFFGPGSHGTTFGGNPISVSAAIATMDIIFNEEFLAEVDEKSNFLISSLKESLQSISLVKEIRGLGLMIGIEINQSAAPILADLRACGLIALSAGEQVIRLLPPLTVSESEMKQAVEIIVSVLKEKM